MRRRGTWDVFENCYYVFPQSLFLYTKSTVCSVFSSSGFLGLCSFLLLTFGLSPVGPSPSWSAVPKTGYSPVCDTVPVLSSLEIIFLLFMRFLLICPSMMFAFLTMMCHSWFIVSLQSTILPQVLFCKSSSQLVSCHLVLWIVST